LLEKEREELIKEVKSKEAEKEDLEAALKEIEKQYVTWMDWWNDSTGKKKTEIKTEIAKLSSQLSRVEGNLKNKSDAIKELKDFMEELQKSRDVALLLD
jgi:peptidoglycan hydrolase CwlO-like protein